MNVGEDNPPTHTGCWEDSMRLKMFAAWGKVWNVSFLLKGSRHYPTHCLSEQRPRASKWSKSGGGTVPLCTQNLRNINTSVKNVSSTLKKGKGTNAPQTKQKVLVGGKNLRLYLTLGEPHCGLVLAFRGWDKSPQMGWTRLVPKWLKELLSSQIHPCG